MRKYRVLQMGKYAFVVEQKFLWFWFGKAGPYGCLESAERAIFRLMEDDEKRAYPAKVIGSSEEYELRYLRQRIEEMEKDK